jgi:hypothetical protein
MSNIIKKDQEESYIALYEELEVRYGAAVAQEIVDQIKKADDQSHNPDFMPVKAVSEVLELFHAETREIVKKLKEARNDNGNLYDLETIRLQKRLKTTFGHYWQAQQSFYKLYKKAIKGCEVKKPYRYDRYTSPTKMAA